MQVSTHNQDTPAANKQHKIEDQLPEYFNHGRILAPLAGIIPDLSFNLVGHHGRNRAGAKSSQSVTSHFIEIHYITPLCPLASIPPTMPQSEALDRTPTKILRQESHVISELNYQVRFGQLAFG